MTAPRGSWNLGPNDVAKYSPDQGRDDHGRWTAGGVAAVTATAVGALGGMAAAHLIARDPGAAVEATKLVSEIVRDHFETYKTYLSAEAANVKNGGRDVGAIAARMANAVRFTAAKVVHESVTEVMDGYEASPRAQRAASSIINGIFRTAMTLKSATPREDDGATVAAVCGLASVVLDHVAAQMSDLIGDDPRVATILKQIVAKMHDELSSASATAAKFAKYSADQSRDDHGRFASGGGAGGSGDDRGAVGAALDDAPESKWDDVKSIAKSVAVGAALTAAAGIAAALAPEAFAIAAGAAAGEAAAAGGASAAEAVAAATTSGQFGWVTAQVKNLAQTAYWAAGMKTARLGLKSLGVNVAAIDQYVKPVEQAYNAVFKGSTSAGIDPRLIEIISGAGDHVHKALLDHIPPQNDIASVINSVAASEGIDAALAEYKSSISALGKSAPVEMRKYSVARATNDAMPTFKTYAERMAWEAAQFFEMADAAADSTAAMRKIGDDHMSLRKNASFAATVTSLADLEAALRRLATNPLPLPLRTMEAAGSA